MKEYDTWNKIETKWKEILLLFQKQYDPKKQTLKTKLEGGDIPRLVLEDRWTKTDTTNFIVKFRDKKLKSKGRKGAKALVTFIQMVGVEKVYELNIPSKRSHTLISDSINGNEANSPIFVDGKYIFTKSENTEKITQIQEIIKKLHLNASIERDNS